MNEPILLTPGPLTTSAATKNAMLRDTILALSSLGFPQDQARKMVQSALDANPAITDTETLLRKALNSK